MNNAINTSDIIFVDAADYESVTGIARSSTEHFGMVKIDLACTCFRMEMIRSLWACLPLLSEEEVRNVLEGKMYIVVNPGSATGLARGSALYPEKAKELSDMDAYIRFIAEPGAEGIAKHLAGRKYCEILEELRSSEGAYADAEERIRILEEVTKQKPNGTTEEFFATSYESAVIEPDPDQGFFWLPPGEEGKEIFDLIRKSSRLLSLRRLGAPVSVINGSSLIVKAQFDKCEKSRLEE